MALLLKGDCYTITPPCYEGNVRPVQIQKEEESMIKGKLSKKDNLTSQVLIEKFSSPFALVNHAIMVLRHRMEAGSADSPEAFSSSAENVVNVVLRDIATGKGGCDIEGQQEIIAAPREVCHHDKHHHASQEVLRSPVVEVAPVAFAEEKAKSSHDLPVEE